MSLAGLLEIADREFQAIQDADRELNSRAESLISAGELQTVEITPGALKAYLDKRIGLMVACQIFLMTGLLAYYFDSVLVH